MVDIPDNDILVLEDDVVLCDDFLGKLDDHIELIDYYQAMEGPSSRSGKPFALTPIYIPEKKCNYTPVKSEELYDIRGHKVFTQKYVDGIFYMTKSLHREVKDWFAQYNGNIPVLESSSGIGRFLSQKMYGAKFNMYGISPSLIGHGDHESIQFGEARKKVPLIAKIT
jgi:hypothetical protein